MHFRVVKTVIKKSIEVDVPPIDVSEKPDKIYITEHTLSEAKRKIIQPEKIRVLLVACQDYENPAYNTIKHPVNDAMKMHKYLKEMRHIPACNFKRYYNAHATKDNVLKGFEWLREFDYGVFYFSGHGYRFNYQGQKREGILLRDHIWQRAKMLLDIDVHNGLCKLKHCVIIFDCCHAGGVIEKGGRKGIVKSVVVPQKLELGKLEKVPPIPKTFDFYTACQPEESAYEDPINGGVFTDELIRLWEQYPDLSNDELSERINGGIKYNQHPLISAENMEFVLFQIGD